MKHLTFKLNDYFLSPFGDQGVGGVGTAPGRTISGVIMIIMNSAIGVAGIIMLFLLLGAGWTIISSQGNNPEGMKKATKTATSAIVGMIVVAFAYFIVQLIERFFFGDNTPLTNPGA